MGWHERIIYHRDFAYNSSRRSRMANGSIGHVPAATFAELLSGSMIDVYVGESKRHWSLHRNLLCHHSESLEEELDGAATGGDKTDKLELLDYDPAGFELLVKWLYQGTLDHVSDMVDANQKYDYAVSCYKLYLLCDRFDMAQLKNVAMDQYRRGLNEAELVPDADEIDAIYRRSPPSSPFRQLMTRIAARQIMDPSSDRDVESYRQCFENNPDFVVDLVRAIKHGTGGVLFEDPTDRGHECEYHDHEAAPNCPTKGKGKLKPAKKTQRPQPALISAKEVPESLPASSDQHRPLLRPLPSPARSRPHPQPRLQDRTSVGPLRHRLTSPASSTVGTSKETVVAPRPPSPDMTRNREKDRERLRKVTPPERRRQVEQAQVNVEETRVELRPVTDAHRQSSEGTSHQVPPSEHYMSDVADGTNGIHKTPQQAPAHGLWDWARAGTGRLGMIGRLPHPQWKGPASSKAPADLSDDHTSSTPMSSSWDDFSVPFTTNPPPHDAQDNRAAAAAKLEGPGVTDASVLASPHFSQTKRSSDDLVAASSTASTPANIATRTEEWENSTPAKASPPATPETPTPQQKNKTIAGDEDRTPTRDVAVKSVNGVDNSEPEDKGYPVNDTAIKAIKASEDRPSRNTDIVIKENNHNQHHKLGNEEAENTSSPRTVSKLKIALAPNVLSPAKSDSISLDKVEDRQSSHT
ncbi:hypothetical protein ACN47E_007493 [Coniothyrium glycines]